MVLAIGGSAFGPYQKLSGTSLPNTIAASGGKAMVFAPVTAPAARADTYRGRGGLRQRRDRFCACGRRIGRVFGAIGGVYGLRQRAGCGR